MFNIVDTPLPTPSPTTPFPTPSPTTTLPSPTTPFPTPSPTPAPSTPCVEDPDDKFFFKLTKDGVYKKKKCSWLVKQEKKEKHCKKKTKYHTNDSGKIFPPPQIVCPITCENYCDPCFENAKTLYSHNQWENGTGVSKTCKELSEKSQDKINEICSRTESYEGYPIPSIACPMTCGVSECVQGGTNIFGSLALALLLSIFL